MIYFLATAAHLYTIRTHLEGRGSALAGHVEPMAYEDLFAGLADDFWWSVQRESWWPISLEPHQRRALRPGTYIFADLERLSAFDTIRAGVVWNALGEIDGPVERLNHPTRSMRRYELLRTLHADGINRFNAYRLTEARWPERYPVFIRDESDHAGTRFPLISSREELEESIAFLDEKGRSRDGVLIVEFCDTSDARGIFRKYGAYVIGDRIVPKNMLVSRNWVVKIGWDGELPGTMLTGEEDAYIAANPHADALVAIARRARIQYGRIDYSVLDGRVQVWEINTNPMITAEAGDAVPTREDVLRDFSLRFASALTHPSLTGTPAQEGGR